MKDNAGEEHARAQEGRDILEVHDKDLRALDSFYHLYLADIRRLEVQTSLNLRPADFHQILDTKLC